MAYTRRFSSVTAVEKGFHTRAKGNKGEDIACKFLENKGFCIADRNYLKPWGELDIVAIKGQIVHFFEVKCVTQDFAGKSDGHRPEDNIHGLKVRHIRRMIDTYMHEYFQGQDMLFQFHAICVFMDMNARSAKVKWIENIIL